MTGVSSLAVNFDHFKLYVGCLPSLLRFVGTHMNIFYARITEGPFVHTYI